VRVILDTNILVSALIVPGGVPDYLYQQWRTGRFTLLTSREQLDEFRRVTRYPRVRKHIRPAAAGTMLNEIRALGEISGPLPVVQVCADPADNFLLSMTQSGQADFLVTRDRQHLLELARYRTTGLLSVRQAARMLGFKQE
jgi:putative PIN family toxin of toxin-antitoxin system